MGLERNGRNKNVLEFDVEKDGWIIFFLNCVFTMLEFIEILNKIGS